MAIVASWEQQAQAAAEAFEVQILVGVRPYGGGWFAHADGIEYDGHTAASAVEAVIDGLSGRAARQGLDGQQQAKRAEAQIARWYASKPASQ